MFFTYNWPALLWMLAIMVLCIIPGNELPDYSILNHDKLGHAGIFGILAVLLLRGFTKQNTFRYLTERPVLVTILICIAYGGITEMIQGLFVYRRVADPLDFLADSTGGIIASAVWFFRKMKRKA